MQRGFGQFRKKITTILWHRWGVHRLVENFKIHERLNLKYCSSERNSKGNPNVCIKVTWAKLWIKAYQIKNWPQTKVRWYFDPTSPGLQANYPNLMPWTKSTNARLARPYACASWAWQSIRTTRLQVWKRRSRSAIGPWRMTSRLSDTLLPRASTTCHSGVNIEISFQISFGQTTSRQNLPNFKHFRFRQELLANTKKNVEILNKMSFEIVSKRCHIRKFFLNIWVSSGRPCTDVLSHTGNLTANEDFFRDVFISFFVFCFIIFFSIHQPEVWCNWWRRKAWRPSIYAPSFMIAYQGFL